MIPILGTALLFIALSLIWGRALLHLLGQRRPSWVSGAVGLAALIVVAPLLIRLPGRATTAAIVIGLATLAAVVLLRRVFVPERRSAGALPDDAPRAPHATAIAAVVIVLAASCLPFLFNERTGVLGQGIYTNDQAAQLFWTDWLQEGFGPEPKAVRFGYPTGPQSLTATVAEVTHADLDDAFNGLLVAIPVLAALAALAALGSLAPVRRVAAASLVALPYLGASFLAQSAFKETAMALLVLALAVVLQLATAGALMRRAAIGAVLVLAAGSVFAYSVPGLAWFALALPIWALAEYALGGRRLDLGRIKDAARRHRVAIGVAALVGLAVAALGAGQAANFAEKIGDVQVSAGRLSSPVFPGEGLGIWPEGDFRVVRGEVGLAIPATLLGLLAVVAGAVLMIRRRFFAPLSVLAAAAIVYGGARAFGSIYIEAKALAVLAPLVVLVTLGGLWGLREGRRGLRIAAVALGVVFAIGAAASTFAALRAAPVGFDERGEALERLAAKAHGERVLFLGVDRFGAYWLRDTLVRSPGGYLPPEVKARAAKVWQQGRAMDFDTARSDTLERFRYAVTTAAAYQSTPPPQAREVARDGDYVLWEMRGRVRPSETLAEGAAPGRLLECTDIPDAKASEATILPTPVVGGVEGWGIDFPADAPFGASRELELGAGEWQLSLQYHSQVAVEVKAPGLQATLPPSLDGMYLTHQGEGAFWPVGGIEVGSGKAPTEIQVSAAEPSAFQDTLGVSRSVWLGEIAATRVDPLTEDPEITALGDACDEFVDHYRPQSPR